jgi:glutathione S-transferase
MQLYIGNKNYSSWSMRSWVLMKHFGIAFDEVMVRFDSFEGQSTFKRQITAVSPAGRVPVLVLEDGLAVWDTMAIAETLAEQFPQHALWPSEAAARARARSLCAEMHAGFAALRNLFPMNIEAALPDVGPRVLADQPDARADLDRIVQMWGQQLAASGGPFLFGDFGIADATYAPVCTRIRTYALPVPDAVAAYIDRVLRSPGVAAWIAGALAEHDFLPSEEPYRTRP